MMDGGIRFLSIVCLVNWHASSCHSSYTIFSFCTLKNSTAKHALFGIGRKGKELTGRGVERIKRETAYSSDEAD